mmetsp:Transcript_19271/g.33363  ORF Transcript_19271/g.33363 Transcript_19271/m.33363 type:complete len:137 (+) Transcript_19271:313-723(+)
MDTDPAPKEVFARLWRQRGRKPCSEMWSPKISGVRFAIALCLAGVQPESFECEGIEKDGEWRYRRIPEHAAETKNVAQELLSTRAMARVLSTRVMAQVLSPRVRSGQRIVQENDVVTREACSTPVQGQRRRPRHSC